VAFILSLVSTTGLKQPLVVLPREVLGPFAAIFGSKAGPRGGVSATWWIFLCERAAGVTAGAVVDAWVAVQGMGAAAGAAGGRRKTE
jgi:hypothetical protein